MIDPDFDPLQDLELCKHNIQELVKGVNHQSSYLRELAAQHEQLTKLLSIHAQRLEQLERRLFDLK